MVGMVVTISPSFSLHRIVVFPAASRPTMRMHISFLPKRPLKRLAKMFPMLVDRWKDTGQGHLSGCCPHPGFGFAPTRWWLSQKGFLMEHSSFLFYLSIYLF